MARRMYHFLRPTLMVICCFVIALLVSQLVGQWPGEKVTVDDGSWAEILTSVDALRKPSPSFTPRDVVRIQLDGLSHADQSFGVLQCMTFASPENRIVTGPLEKFARMVRTTPFDILSSPDAVLIGDPQASDGLVRVLVTVVRGELCSGFVWVLSRQESAPFHGCWMTDAVFPLDLMRGRGSGSSFPDQTI